MGLLTAVTQSIKRKNAQNIIEALLDAQRKHGFFGGDAKEAARQVASFPGLYPQAYDLSHPILAGLMLARYVTGSKMPHGELLPYGSACSYALSIANDPKLFPAGPSGADQIGIELCLTALQQFYDASPIKLTPEDVDSTPAAASHRGLSDKDAIPITDADSSMLCILREYEWLNERYGGKSGWQMGSQSHVEKDGRSYDVLGISVPGREPQTHWFDITDSKQRWTDHGNISDLAHIGAFFDLKKDR